MKKTTTKTTSKAATASRYDKFKDGKVSKTLTTAAPGIFFIETKNEAGNITTEMLHIYGLPDHIRATIKGLPKK